MSAARFQVVSVARSVHVSVLLNRLRQWVWRVRLDGEMVATAARSYARQVRARMTCDAFLQLVAETAVSAPVQVMYR